jgi:hypothetical protein
MTVSPDDLRLLVLVRCRQVGEARVARALARDDEALERMRDSQARQPSPVLANVLRLADAERRS